MEELKFIVDDFEAYDKPELDKVINSISAKPKPWMSKAMFLKSYFYAVVKSYPIVAKKWEEERLRKESPENRKKELEEKKKKLMEKLDKLKDVEDNKEEFVTEIPTEEETKEDNHTIDESIFNELPSTEPLPPEIS